MHRTTTPTTGTPTTGTPAPAAHPVDRRHRGPARLAAWAAALTILGAACTETGVPSTAPDSTGPAPGTMVVDTSSAVPEASPAVDAPVEPVDQKESFPGTPADEQVPGSGETDETLGAGAGVVLAGPVDLGEAPPDRVPPAPIELLAVDNPAPEAPAAPAASMLHPTPSGDLVSNTPGCASRCVTSARLVPDALTPEFDVEIATNTPVSIRVFRSTRAAVVGADGTAHIPGVHLAAARKLTRVTQWSTTLGDLEPDTLYHVVVKVTDRWGNHEYLTGTARTAGRADDFAAGTPCELQCITSAVLTPTDSVDRMTLRVETNAAATLSVFVSTQEPGWIAGNPILPADVPVPVPTDAARSWGLDVRHLTPDTTYHVVVRAEDAAGGVSHRIGEFRTQPEPPIDVLVTFEWIQIAHDGDDSDWNLGEIAFSWGSAPGVTAHWGSRSYDKIDDGDVIGLAMQTSKWFTVEQGGTLPDLRMAAIETDVVNLDGSVCRNEVPLLLEQPSENFGCETKSTPAILYDVDIDWVQERLSCSNYGFAGPKADDRCILVHSDAPGDDYVEYAYLVSFHFA